jgi:hypothetical protein
VGDNAGNASDVRETRQQISERQCGQCFRCEGDETADEKADIGCKSDRVKSSRCLGSDMTVKWQIGESSYARVRNEEQCSVSGGLCKRYVAGGG